MKFRQRWLYWVFLIIALVAMSVIGFFLGREKGRREARLVPPAPPPTAPALPPEARKTVRLYFASEEANSLKEELREIPKAANVVEEAKEVITELIKGPSQGLLPTIPAGVELRQLFIDSKGIAYVDFNREIQTKHPGGSAGELLTIYSIVDSLTANFEDIKRVQILVEGAEIPTLAGHIDTRQPLRPRLSFEVPR